MLARSSSWIPAAREPRTRPAGPVPAPGGGDPVKGRNPSLAAKAGLGAGSTLLGLGWRLGRRSVAGKEHLVRTVGAHPRGPDLAHRFCWAAMDSGQSADHK